MYTQLKDPFDPCLDGSNKQITSFSCQVCFADSISSLSRLKLTTGCSKIMILNTYIYTRSIALPILACTHHLINKTTFTRSCCLPVTPGKTWDKEDTDNADDLKEVVDTRKRSADLLKTSSETILTKRTLMDSQMNMVSNSQLLILQRTSLRRLA